MALITAPGALPELHIVGAYFQVVVDGRTKGSRFTDVGGLSMELNVVEITTSGMLRTQTRKTPGLAKYGELTLKRKFSMNMEFWDWVKEIRDGGPAEKFRHNGSVYQLASHGIGEPVAEWKFINAWPSKWSISDPDVSSDDAIDESITLAIESLERVK